MAYNPENDNSHQRYYCEVHKKDIFFFTKDKALTGAHCWDCLKEQNDASWKKSFLKKKEEEDE